MSSATFKFTIHLKSIQAIDNQILLSVPFFYSLYSRNNSFITTSKEHQMNCIIFLVSILTQTLFKGIMNKIFQNLIFNSQERTKFMSLNNTFKIFFSFRN
jgi:hypothetical protein